jgi:hypothetical protein
MSTRANDELEQIEARRATRPDTFRPKLPTRSVDFGEPPRA